MVHILNNVCGFFGDAVLSDHMLYHMVHVPLARHGILLMIFRRISNQATISVAFRSPTEWTILVSLFDS